MNEIMISVQPQHAINILNGTKTLELRKSVPKDFVGWVNVYVTKGKPYLQVFDDEIIKSFPKTPKYIVDNDWHGTTDILNGKVVARFWFDENDYETIQSKEICNSWDDECWEEFVSENLDQSAIMEYSCLDSLDILRYALTKDGWDTRTIYGWYIDNLEIFDNPKQLGDFSHLNKKELMYYKSLLERKEETKWLLMRTAVTKAPQSWQWVVKR